MYIFINEKLVYKQQSMFVLYGWNAMAINLKINVIKLFENVLLILGISHTQTIVKW